MEYESKQRDEALEGEHRDAWPVDARLAMSSSGSRGGS